MVAATLATVLPVYVAGLLCASANLFPALSPLWVGIAALAWLLLRRQRIAACVVIHCLFFLLGISLYQLCRYPDVPAGHISEWDRQKITLDATINSLEHSGDGFRLDLALLTIVAPGPAKPAGGELRLHLDDARQLAPGDRIRLQGVVRKPQLFGTPGEFDAPEQLAVSGIFARVVTSPENPLLLLQSRHQDRPLAARRLAVDKLIGSAVPATTAPLVRALTIGNMGGDRSLTDLLARGGLSHLFSISGLHLGLIATALYAIGLTAWRRWPVLQAWPPARFLPLFIAPLLVLYLFWSGNAHATQRALLMVLGAAGLLLLRRRTSPLRLLGGAVFVMLLLNPLTLFAPSLQLSVCGVAGIILVHPRVTKSTASFPPLLRGTISLLAATAAATLTTLPIVLYHFHLLAPAGLLANLFAIPVVSWLSVPLAMAAVLLQPLSEGAAALLFAGCGETIQWVLGVTKGLLALPGCGGWPLYLSLPAIAGIALGSAALLAPRWPVPLRIVLLLVAISATALPLPHPATLTVTAFSVGQGESILLSPDGDRQLLIDGGGLYGDRFDTGERLVAPALGRLGISSLAAVVMTHTHPDHSKGLAYILATFHVEEFWLRDDVRLDGQLATILEQRRIPLRRFAPGWTMLDAPDKGVLAVFAANDSAPGENDRSLVIYAGNRRDGVLLTADLEQDGVSQLLAAPLPGPVTLLKLPHHGSRHSTPLRLVDALVPQQTFVSAGRDNRFHFPHPEVVTALAARAVPLARTDSDGTVQFMATKQGWLNRRWEAGLFR